jgi:hypothetical protein
MCSAFTQDQDERTFTVGFLAPLYHLGNQDLHHLTFEYLLISKSAGLMSYFVVLFGNPESQICASDVLSDNQRGLMKLPSAQMQPVKVVRFPIRLTGTGMESTSNTCRP